MKTSCIHQPANEPLVIIRQWQIEFCDGNTTAAALLSFFEYWHNVKLDAAKQNQKANEVAAAHGEQQTQDTSLYQWHTEDDLAAGIMGIAKSPKTIAAALSILVENGAISIHRNPSPRFKFDKTRHFLFYPDVVNGWLEARSGNFTLSSSKNVSRQGKKDLRSSENTPAIPETTNETSSEQIGATPVETPNPGKPKPTKPRLVLDEQQQDELLTFGIVGETARNNVPKVNDTYQAERDIAAVWKREIADDTRAAIIVLLVAIRTVSPNYQAPATKPDQGAWGAGAADHLKIYSLAELRQLYPAAVEYNLKHDLNYFRPQSLTQTLQRLKHGNFNQNGNGASAINPLTPTGSVRIG